MQVDVTLFYNWIKHTRRGLFDFLHTIPADDYLLPRIAGKSILELQAHTCDCYQRWVGHVLSGHPLSPIAPKSLAEVEAAFTSVDRLVTQAIAAGKTGWIHWTDEEGRSDNFPAEWLLLHPMTHEFHHKGQLVLIARLLGHTYPPGHDSDLSYAPIHG